MISTALEHYLGKNGKVRKNCAQAVLCGFQSSLNITETQIDAFSVYGTGKAPENICGAIYAAQTLLEKETDAKSIEKLQAYFTEYAGSVKCREIRGHKKMSCMGCVENATRFVAENLFGESTMIESEKAR